MRAVAVVARRPRGARERGPVDVACAGVATGAVVGAALGGGCAAHAAETVALADGARGLGVGLGIAMFTFAAHVVCPEIRGDGRAARQLQARARRGVALVLVAFAAIAAAGYAGLGPSVADQFTIRAPAAANARAASASTRASFGLLVATPCKLIEGAVAAAASGEPGRAELAPLPPSPAIRALVVAAQCLIAVRFPNFATVLSVIGCARPSRSSSCRACSTSP